MYGNAASTRVARCAQGGSQRRVYGGWCCGDSGFAGARQAASGGGFLPTVEASFRGGKAEGMVRLRIPRIVLVLLSFRPDGACGLRVAPSLSVQLQFEWLFPVFHGALVSPPPPPNRTGNACGDKQRYAREAVLRQVVFKDDQRSRDAKAKALQRWRLAAAAAAMKDLRWQQRSRSLERGAVLTGDIMSRRDEERLLAGFQRWRDADAKVM